MRAREQLLDTEEVTAGKEVSQDIVSRRDSLWPDGEVVLEAEAEDFPQETLGERVTGTSRAEAMLDILVVDMHHHEGGTRPKRKEAS